MRNMTAKENQFEKEKTKKNQSAAEKAEAEKFNEILNA
jgi:hypothetical protein